MSEPDTKGAESTAQECVSIPCVKGNDQQPLSECTAQATYVFGSGRYQVLLLLFAQAAIFVSYAQISIQVVNYYPIDYWCRPPSEYSYMSTALWFNSSIPRRPDGSYSRCSRYDRPIAAGPKHNATEVPCEHWDYVRSAHGYSIITEWDLVCNRAWFVYWSHATFLTGSAVCVPLIGFVSDRFGRRPMLYVFVFMLFSCAVSQCFAQSFETFVILRLLFSASASVLEVTASILVFESTPPGRREAFVALAVCIPTVVAFPYVSAVSIIAFDWRGLHLAIAVPSVLLVALVCLTSESLHWLLVHARYEEAEQVALWAARLNKDDAGMIKERLQAVIDALTSADKKKGRETPHFYRLFTGTMRSRCFVIFGCWFFFYVAYFSPNLELAADSLHDIAGVATIVNAVAMIAAYFITTMCGQRYPAVVLSLLSSACIATQAVLTLYALLPPLAWAITAGHTLFNMAYVPLYILTVDIFPMQVRCSGLSFAYMCGSLGKVTAVVIKYVDNLMPPNVQTLQKAAIAVGVATFFMGILFLPAHFSVESMEERKENIFAQRKRSLHSGAK
ncbi:solute carrier family 22 member 6-B-like [Amblyomma americanum]